MHPQATSLTTTLHEKQTAFRRTYLVRGVDAWRLTSLLAMHADIKQVYTCALMLNPYFFGSCRTASKARVNLPALPNILIKIVRVKFEGGMPELCICCQSCSHRSGRRRREFVKYEISGSGSEANSHQGPNAAIKQRIVQDSVRSDATLSHSSQQLHSTGNISLDTIPEAGGGSSGREGARQRNTSHPIKQNKQGGGCMLKLKMNLLIKTGCRCTLINYVPQGIKRKTVFLPHPFAIVENVIRSGSTPDVSMSSNKPAALSIAPTLAQAS
eukprot:284818305_3